MTWMTLDNIVLGGLQVILLGLLVTVYWKALKKENQS